MSLDCLIGSSYNSNSNTVQVSSRKGIVLLTKLRSCEWREAQASGMASFRGCRDGLNGCLALPSSGLDLQAGFLSVRIGQLTDLGLTASRLSRCYWKIFLEEGQD